MLKLRHTNSNVCQVVIIAVSVTVVSLYWCIQQSAATEIFAEYVQGDISAYIVRFTASCVLLGVVPLLTMLLLGYSMRDIGLRRSVDRAFTMRVLLVGVAVCIFFGISGSRNADMAAFYPYSKTIALYAATNPLWLALHVGSYVVFYYMPWEIFFRGILLLPFVNYEDAAQMPGGDGLQTARSRWKFPPAVVFMQVIPSTMLHFGHPPVELCASILFGFFAGYLVWRTRSIFTLWILHSVAGVAQDIAIIMQ